MHPFATGGSKGSSLVQVTDKNLGKPSPFRSSLPPAESSQRLALRRHTP